MKTDTTLAATFVEHLGLWPWTLAAGSVVQTCANRYEAAAFLQKHARHVPAVMLDLRLVGVEIPASARDAIERNAWHERAHLRIDQGERSIFAWRLLHPDFNTFAEVERSITAFAERFAAENGCTCKPVTIDMPIPELGNGWSWHRTVPGELHHTRIMKVPPTMKRGKPNEKAFVRGDAMDDEAEIPDIKEDWLASENFTFYVGRPKAGKSLAVAKTAAYITAGGTWDGDGKWSTAWWDGSPIARHARGSVIIGEQEDKVAQTKARCRAAGCDMSKVHIRRMLPDISVPSQLKEWTDLAESLGDCRMMAFSPVQDALKIKDNAEAAVRRKFEPILAWANGKGIALVGVLHTNDDGTLAGSDVLFRVVRCVVLFEDNVMSVRNSNIGPTGMPTPFAVEKIISQGVKTARIVFGAATAGVTGSPGTSQPSTPSPASEPPRRFTAAQRRYIEWLAELIPPLTAGGVPMEGSTVRRLAREHGLTSVDNLNEAGDILGIERRKRDGAPPTEPALWVPASEFPAGIERTLARP